MIYEPSSEKVNLQNKLADLEKKFDSIQQAITEKDKLLYDKRSKHQEFVRTTVDNEIKRKKVLIQIEEDKKWSENKETDILRAKLYEVIGGQFEIFGHESRTRISQHQEEVEFEKRKKEWELDMQKKERETQQMVKKAGNI